MSGGCELIWRVAQPWPDLSCCPGTCLGKLRKIAKNLRTARLGAEPGLSRSRSASHSVWLLLEGWWLKSHEGGFSGHFCLWRQSVVFLCYADYVKNLQKHVNIDRIIFRCGTPCCCPACQLRILFPSSTGMYSVSSKHYLYVGVFACTKKEFLRALLVCLYCVSAVPLLQGRLWVFRSITGRRVM
jgi:hypothetical protein